MKKKLTVERFIKVMGYLMAYYTNFNFNLFDVETLDNKGNQVPTYQTLVWYDAFKDMYEEDFVNLIQDYSKNNVYAPLSPTSIFEYYASKVDENSLLPSVAFEKALDIVKELGWWISEENVNGIDISESIKESILATKTDFQILANKSDHKSFAKNNFEKVYKEIEKRNIQKQKRNLMLGNISEKNMLTGGEK